MGSENLGFLGLSGSDFSNFQVSDILLTPLAAVAGAETGATACTEDATPAAPSAVAIAKNGVAIVGVEAGATTAGATALGAEVVIENTVAVKVLKLLLKKMQ